MVKRDDMNAAPSDVRQRFVSVRRVRHLESATAKRFLDEPHQCDVVVDTTLMVDSSTRSGIRRHLDDRKEQTELLYGVGKPFVVHRLGDVDIGAEIVAMLDLAAVVRRRQHNDG